MTQPSRPTPDDDAPPSQGAESDAFAASGWQGARGRKWAAHLAGMEAMLEPVNAPLIRALCVDRPCRIADVACGGGSTTRALLRQVPAGSVVHGFDISETLVAAARKAAEREALVFEAADLATAAPPGEGYQRLVSRFGVMFFDEPEAAFRNLLRWLEPSGRFAFAVWGPPADNPWATVVRDVVSEVVELPPSASDAPGMFRYADVAPLVALLEQAGFEEVKVTDWRGALSIGGAVDHDGATRFALASFGFLAEAMAAAGTAAVAASHRSLRQRFLQVSPTTPVELQARAHLVTGRRGDHPS